MVTIKDIKIENLKNAGCNNGNYPAVVITLSSGETLEGNTCGCGRGCANTWNVDALEQILETRIVVFKDAAEILDILEYRGSGRDS